jgi:hypothetical protein
MGEGMPYHLEKGPLLRILERDLNADRATMQARLNTLKSGMNSDSVDWIIGSTAWNDPAFSKPGAPSGQQMCERVITEWFGYEPKPGGGWRKPNPPKPTTGYWIGYQGDVNRIVRRAFAWAVELALGTGSDDRADAAPWPIELFWKCPAPWFEAWVVSRRQQSTTSGLVTLILVSPSHRAAVVADSPIAHSATASPPGAKHPVPSFEDDYELLDQHPHPKPNRPRVAPATNRDTATWVVSQERHNIFGNIGERDLARQVNTALRALFGEWSIPQLASWAGEGEVVVVAPSMAAGGVKHDGAV